jgi:hypothetical protein
MKKALQEIDDYLSELHQGSVNIVIHFIGIAFFGYGIGIENWFVIATGPLIMELGHVYGYATGKDRKRIRKTIPLQIGSWFLLMGIAYAALKAF